MEEGSMEEGSMVTCFSISAGGKVGYTHRVGRGGGSKGGKQAELLPMGSKP